jgi:hypothetical protein
VKWVYILNESPSYPIGIIQSDRERFWEIN